VLPEDVWLKDFAAASPFPASSSTPAVAVAGQPPTLLTINGYTYSHDAVARLMSRLAVIPDLQNVWLSQSTLSELGGRPIVTFTLKADVRSGGPTS
jgi:Tfp pilus assembly protein PilN